MKYGIPLSQHSSFVTSRRKWPLYCQSTKNCKTFNGHLRLAPKASQSLSEHMLKCPTLQQKLTCLQPGTKTVLVSLPKFPLKSTLEWYLHIFKSAPHAVLMERGPTALFWCPGLALWFNPALYEADSTEQTAVCCSSQHAQLMHTH